MAREQAREQAHEGHEGRRARGSSLAWTLGLGAVVVVLLALVLVPVIDAAAGRETPLTPLARRLPLAGAAWLRPSDDTGAVTVDDIAARPRAFAGETVSVTGAVGQVISRRAFTMGDGGYLDDGLLVVTNRPLRGVVGGPAGQTGAEAGQLVLADREVVEVTGEVRLFDIGEIEREMGVRLDESRFADWTGRPVVLATAVGPPGQGAAARAPAAQAQPSPQDDTARPTARQRPLQPTPQGTPASPASPASPTPAAQATRAARGDAAGTAGDSAAATTGTTATVAVAVDDLARDPDRFVGKTVTVTGEVGEVLGRRAHTAFTLEDEDFLFDESVLVIGDRPEASAAGQGGLPLIEESQVRVTGTVRYFDRTALERDLGLTLSPELYAPWSGRPVIVFSAIDLTPAP
jgi:hypothetical protein